MSRTISVKCPKWDCGHTNVFQEDELVGAIAIVDENGERGNPPPVEVDENTFVQCEKCNGPVNCANATISD